MKKVMITLGLMTLSTVALSACANPHQDDQHPHTSGAEQPMMMAHGESGMSGMHGEGGHMEHGDMHGEGDHMEHGGMHGEGGHMEDGGMMGHTMDHHDGDHQQGQHGHGDSPFAASHDRMMDDMHGFELTGDPDYDFVRGMIPHHQGAIDMAQVHLESGSDPELLALSEAIIDAQRAEIAEMEAWLESYGEPRPADQASNIRSGYQRTNDRMMRDMQIGPSGDTDRDFVLGMIPHHEAAIDMARILLQYSDNAELRALAQDIIREQEEEVHSMQAWLER